MENRVRFKIGEIEFEAEGSAEIIERERSEFINRLLPAAIDAIVRTRGIDPQMQNIEAPNSAALLPEATNNTAIIPETIETVLTNEFSRTNLASFLKRYGTVSDQDFTLISAYFDEKKNGTSFFTSESVKEYYTEARRSEYSNRSSLLFQLARKGYIMDNPGTDGKLPKQYILTMEGMAYVEAYKPKEEADEKKKATPKPKKARSVNPSTYEGLNLDELNLKNYPAVKSLNTFKKQIIVIMYIVTNEGKGEFFSVADIMHLMTNVWGLSATVDQVNGIFKHNRAWFKQEMDPINKKAVIRKLLESGKDFAREVIRPFTNGVTKNMNS